MLLSLFICGILMIWVGLAARLVADRRRINALIKADLEAPIIPIRRK